MVTCANFIKRPKVLLFVIVSIAIVITAYLYNAYNSEIKRNERTFDSLVARHYERTENGNFWLSSFAFFEWHRAYIFQPGTTRLEIEGIIGFVDRNIPSVIVEGYTQILFVAHIGGSDDLRIVTANIHGTKPYRIYVEGLTEGNFVRLNRYARGRIDVGLEGEIKVLLDTNPFLSWEGLTLLHSSSDAVDTLERRIDLYTERIKEFYDGDLDKDFWFTDLAAFLWDHAYIFQPGTTRSEIEAIIGFEDRNIPELIREEYTQILFVNDSHMDSDIWSVAANIHDIKPYRFYVEGLEGESYARINFKTARARLKIQPDNIVNIIIYPNLD